MIDIERKINQIMRDMNVDVNSLNSRDKQVIAQDVSRKLRFTKKEVYKVLVDL